MLKDQTAIVTGGSRGIGRAVCLALAAQGLDIVVNYAGSAAAAAETAALCEEKGVKAITVQADVSTAEGCETLFALADARPQATDTASIARTLGTYFQKQPLMRAGRKFSMSEELRARKAVVPYLLEPAVKDSRMADGAWTQAIAYANAQFEADGQVAYTSLTEGGIKIRYSFAPRTPGKLLLEAGIGFLLDADLRYMQWMGFGPYASYPGKQSANSYGLHALCAGDLYFEGNRMGIDALACTDGQGNGFLLVAPGCNLNFEETDHGVVLSVNPVVSGLGGKLRATAYPVYTDDTRQIEGSLVLYPLRAGAWPQALKPLFFDEPARHIEPQNPFLSVYDTYLLKYDDTVR